MDKSKWEYKKLGEVCEVLNGLWVGKKPPFKEVGVIRNANFTKDCQLRTDNIAIIQVEEKQFKKKQLQRGDIIVEKSGGSDIQPVGRPIIFNLEGSFSFSNFTSALRIKEDIPLNPDFLHKCLLAYYLFGVTRNMQSKTTGLRNLDLKRYKGMLVPIPLQNIQKYIVTELDQLNELISLKQQQLKEYDALAQSIFYEMFGDPLSNKKGFERNKLGAITKVGSSRRVFSTEFRDKGIPFYRGTEIAAIAEGSFEGPTLFISKDRYDELVSQTGQPQLGDLLLPSICPNGRIMVVRDASRFYIKDGRVLWIRANRKKFVSEYLKFVLSIILLRDYNKYASGATFKELKIFTLSSVPIPLPPLTLQQSFAERVRAIERQKALVKQSIAEVQTLLDSRMQEYFG